MTKQKFISTRRIVLEALLTRLKGEGLLSESQVKHIMIEKAIQQYNLFEF